MSVLTLEKYMSMMKLSVADIAKDIGRTRQNVDFWIERGATVDLTEAGIKIITLNVVHPRSVTIVHESQVKKL